jgi:hypothetical protein
LPSKSDYPARSYDQSDGISVGTDALNIP